MPTLDVEEIAEILAPYLANTSEIGGESDAIPSGMLRGLSVYLDLLIKWNERTNLTAIRDPRRIVERHFGESLFLARHLTGTGSLLDLGSGAGFPGIPVQLWHPSLQVTLAESQNKKATFLREVVRSLELPTRVWAGRAEDLASIRSFDHVALRAVDRPDHALKLAFRLSTSDIWLLGTAASLDGAATAGSLLHKLRIPGQEESHLYQLRAIVPRGT